jgi:hypothetical protein
MKPHLSLVVILVGWAPLAMARPVLSPARRHAIKAPILQLRREAFRIAADAFVEVERPTFARLGGPGSDPRALGFATKADSAGDPGLCKATTAWVLLKPLKGEDPIETSQVYKVAGSLRPLPDMWNATYGAQLSAKCRRAGRVLPSATADFGQVGFFTVSPSEQHLAWFGARSLEIAKDEVSASRIQVSCKVPKDIIEAEKDSTQPRPTRDQSNIRDCEAPRDVMRSLALSRLMSIDVAPCEHAAGLSCVTGTFLRSADFNEQYVWTVSLEARPGKEFNSDVAEVASITLSTGWIIHD